MGLFILKTTFLLSLCAALSFCGGGSSGTQDEPTLPQKSRQPVIMIFGDSIAAGIDSPLCSSLWPYNRSEGGLMAVHAVAKFKAAVDVIRPAIIILQIGTNDLAQRDLLDVPPSAYLDSMREMVGYARDRGAVVILGSLTPVCGDVQEAWRPPEVIREYNAALLILAGETGARWVDLYSPMAGPDGLARQEYVIDGLHPSPLGYGVMEIEICRAVYQ